MISGSTRFFIWMTVWIFFLFHNPFPADSAQTLIRQTCKSMARSNPTNIKYHFCINSLEGAPASQCANLTRLGQISINLVKNNVTDTKCLVRRLLDNKHVNNRTKVGLRDCYDLYSDTMTNVREAAMDYRANRYADANVKVSSIIGSSTTCNQGFRYIRAENPLKQRNNNIFQLSAISLAFINLFHGTHSTTTS